MCKSNKMKCANFWFVMLCLYLLCAGYVDALMDLIFEEVFVNPEPYTEAMNATRVPEDLSAQCNKPDKEEVIASFVSRFKR